MINISQIKNGIANYVDCEILPNVPDAGYKKIIIATAAGIISIRIENALSKIKNNQMLKLFDIVNDNGEVDVDIIFDEFCKHIPRTGLTLDVPLVGEMTFHVSDLHTLRNYIGG